MRKLSLNTFLLRSLQALSENGQTAPRKLSLEAVRNPRLLPPLCLYAAFAMEPVRRERLIETSAVMKKEFERQPILSCSVEGLEKALNDISDPEDAYYKLWRSYLSVRDRQKADDETKLLYHARVTKIQKEKGITNYRIYTDLKLNPGNLNAWLTHGDCSKLSLDTARRTLRYVQEYTKA